jgi:tetratricopeptide (TPR) repeat protein
VKTGTRPNSAFDGLWNEAEQRFRRIVEEVDQRIAADGEGAINKMVEIPLTEDDMTLGTVSASAHCGVAASLEGREIYLDQAIAELGRARRVANGLDSADLKAKSLALCDLLEGVVLFRQNSLDAALERLEAALAFQPSVNVYFNLAQVLARKIELSCSDGHDHTVLKERAIRYCENAQKLDMNDEEEQKIAQLRTRLESIAVAPSSQTPCGGSSGKPSS